MRRLLTLGVLCLASIGPCQTSIKLVFPDAHRRAIWVGPDPQPNSPTESESATLSIPNGDGSVWVWDKQTGRLAGRPVKDLKGAWTLTSKDFKLLANAIVRVEHGGKPVASAQIDLPGSSTLLSPSDKGEVAVYGVAPPAAKLTVKYKTKSGDAGAISASFDFNLENASKPVKWIVAIPEDVDTVGDAPIGANPTTGVAGETKPAEPKNPLGRLVILVIALAAGAAVVYAILRYLKTNQDAVADKLRQLGVDVPKTPGDDPANLPIQPIKPEPPQKIILDDATPSANSGPAPAVGEPRMVASNGDAFEVPQGETVIGRDLGLGLSLPNETTVSRRHASMRRTGSTVFVKDLGSSNGTFVNGAKIVDEVVIRPGDQVQFGQAQFRFEG